ncbi:MAG: spermidine/putrescine ABC transporter substrate-binding protein [Candidatus Cloacimonetes bacterium]|nr:spermidine/putrescine ABC transporter substrate-binding protein [Candidatus Cloacimonadota bacterium]
MRRSVLIVGVVLVALFSSGCTQKAKLRVYNWVDYIDPSLVTEFETANNCKVSIDTYGTNEEMLEHLMEYPGKYDIACPSGDHLQILQNMNLIEKLDKELIPNYSNLDLEILQKNSSYDTNNEYGIPYFWGVSGIAYNRNLVDLNPESEVSWDILSDARYKGKIILLEDRRDLVGTALILLGCDPNDTSEENLTRAYEVLKRWDENGAIYHSPNQKKEISDNESCLAMAYNGDANSTIKDFPFIDYVLCKEGSTFWIDSLVIPKKAKNKELAYKFINYLCSPEIAARNADYVRYPSPNKTAYDTLISPEMKNNKTIYPDSTYLKKCIPLNYIGDQTTKIDSLWELLEPGSKKL